MTAKTTSPFDSFAKRAVVGQQYFFDYNGEPQEFGLIGTMQWAALAATYPSISALLQGKAPTADNVGAGDQDVAMQADVIALGVCIADAKGGVIDTDKLEQAVEFARSMVPAEREEAFLSIFMESQPSYKKLFLAAVAEAAQEPESLGTANRRTRRATAKKPSATPKRAKSTASSS